VYTEKRKKNKNTINIESKQPTQIYSLLDQLHSESKTVPLYIRSHLWKCWSIFKIISPLYSPRNLQQSFCQHFPPHFKCVTALPCETYNLKFNRYQLQLLQTLPKNQCFTYLT